MGHRARLAVRALAVLAQLLAATAPAFLASPWPSATIIRWAYTGRRDLTAPPEAPGFSVARHLSPALPPLFVSAGNGDFLLAHSRLLVAEAGRHGIRVDTLFFPDDTSPALPHEYQFNLDTDAGHAALDRVVAFLDDLAPTP